MPYPQNSQRPLQSDQYPPDAALTLAGGQAGLPMPPQQPSTVSPDQTGAYPDQTGMGMGMGEMGAVDPMQMIKSQFEPMVDQLQLLAQSFPMAAEELQAAGEAIARAMLKVAQGMQPNPMSPPVPA